MKRKMISVPLRLEGKVWLMVCEVAEVSGYKPDTVASVLVTIGFLKQMPMLARGLEALKAERKAQRRKRK